MIVKIWSKGQSEIKMSYDDHVFSAQSDYMSRRLSKDYDPIR
jgi:hypothetical protein